MIQEFKALIRKTPLYSILLHFRKRIAFIISPLNDIKERSFYSYFINPGDIVFDVGANVGNRTKIFLDLKSRVIAFEPQESCADYLQTEFNKNTNFTLVRKALGASVGTAQMYISNSHPISSLSPEWIDATRRSGRFGKYQWKKKQSVNITTLDLSIQEFGKPSFIKIDVEGYEYEVLSGLSQPVDYISIEFTPEYLDSTFRCLDHIEKIARNPFFQLSLGESMSFLLDSWVPSRGIRDALSALEPTVFGDVYIRCTRSPDG